jgi:S-adenosylmethionine:tRNA ribosyltransferase-isomerase
MKTADFDYHLPEEKIAFRPLEDRQNSRLMVLDRNEGKRSHRRFADLPELLKEGDLLVLNNTKVIPARLTGRRESGAGIEVLLLGKHDDRSWKCLVRNPRQDLKIEFEQGVAGRLLRNGTGWLIEFGERSDDFIHNIGRMPLPPYIKREPDERDKLTYQTVYAKTPGAIAAPTAGLHFTEQMLATLRERGIEVRDVTLHVGIGTFKPVKAENIQEHEMHAEYREIPPETASAVNAARAQGRRVVSVGTTVMRTLESSMDDNGEVLPCSGSTDIFIYPGFKFRAVDALITNFHLPRSTLLMLVSAFAGREFILSAYEEAKDAGYRFLSYGDAMLII